MKQFLSRYRKGILIVSGLIIILTTVGLTLDVKLINHQITEAQESSLSVFVGYYKRIQYVLIRFSTEKGSYVAALVPEPERIAEGLTSKDITTQIRSLRLTEYYPQRFSKVLSQLMKSDNPEIALLAATATIKIDQNIAVQDYVHLAAIVKNCYRSRYSSSVIGSWDYIKEEFLKCEMQNDLPNALDSVITLLQHHLYDEAENILIHLATQENDNVLIDQYLGFCLLGKATSEIDYWEAIYRYERAMLNASFPGYRQDLQIELRSYLDLLQKRGVYLDEALLYCAKGRVLASRKKRQDAQKYYDKALELSPKSPIVHGLIAMFYAETEYDKALDLKPAGFFA